MNQRYDCQASDKIVDENLLIVGQLVLGTKRQCRKIEKLKMKLFVGIIILRLLSYMVIISRRFFF